MKFIRSVASRISFSSSCTAKSSTFSDAIKCDKQRENIIRLKRLIHTSISRWCDFRIFITLQGSRRKKLFYDNVNLMQIFGFGDNRSRLIVAKQRETSDRQIDGESLLYDARVAKHVSHCFDEISEPNTLLKLENRCVIKLG